MTITIDPQDIFILKQRDECDFYLIQQRRNKFRNVGDSK